MSTRSLVISSGLVPLLSPPCARRRTQCLIDVGRFQQWVGLQNPLAADAGEGHGVIVGRSPWNPSFGSGAQQPHVGLADQPVAADQGFAAFPKPIEG